MNPLFFALLGAISASLGTIFAKFGLKGVDSNLLTAVRGIIMAIVVTLFGFFISKISFSSLQALTVKNWVFVILSALGGALSWLFFYYALSHGNVIGVTVIDKLSIVITTILAVIILSEKNFFIIWYWYCSHCCRECFSCYTNRKNFKYF
jgi:transporter family protein